MQSDWGFRRVYFHVLFVFIVRLCPRSSLGSILPFSCVSLSLFVQETIVSATPAPGTWQHLGAATPVHHTCHLPATTIHTNRSFVCVKDFCTWWDMCNKCRQLYARIVRQVESWQFDYLKLRYGKKMEESCSLSGLKRPKDLTLINEQSTILKVARQQIFIMLCEFRPTSSQPWQPR